MSESKFIADVHMSSAQALPMIVQVDTIYIHPNIHIIDVTNSDGTTRQEYVSDEYQYELSVENMRVASALLCAKYVENSTLNASISDLKTVTGTEDIDTSTLDGAKKLKLREISNICQQTIDAGIDVTTSLGIEHFSATIYDQKNILALKAEIMNGATQVAYHANGKLCRMFTATEFTTVSNEISNFVFYHTTLCNHINTWIKRCDTIDDVNTITYSSKLPDDLQSNLNIVLGITK